MITVSKGELRENLQEYLRQVEETGEEIIVTSNDTPVIKIMSLKNADDAFADEAVKIKHHGDILEEKIEQKAEEWEEF